MTLEPNRTDAGIPAPQELFQRGALLGSLELCASVVDRLRTEGATAEDMVERIILPTLVAVGGPWERHEIGVGQEHLATSVCERIIHHLFPPVVSGLDGTKRVLLLNSPGNRHSLGPRILANILEKRRFYVDFLGGDTPAEEALEFARITHPRAVGISLSIDDQVPATRALIGRIREVLPRTKFLVGGAALDLDPVRCGADAAPRGFRQVVATLEEWLGEPDGPVLSLAPALRK